MTGAVIAPNWESPASKSALAEDARPAGIEATCGRASPLPKASRSVGDDCTWYPRSGGGVSLESAVRRSGTTRAYERPWHTWLVPRRPNAPTFNEIVKEVREVSHEGAVVGRGPGLYPDERGEVELVDSDGRSYRLTSAEVTALEALQLARSGAGIVWDPCGCGGGCGMTWLSKEEVNAAEAAGPPRIVRKPGRHIGNISSWSTEHGEVYLLAEDKVVWGTHLW